VMMILRPASRAIVVSCLVRSGFFNERPILTAARRGDRDQRP